MFDRKSDYALNKTEPHAIVFKTAAGAYIRLHCEDFSSEEEFQRWKDWSDRLGSFRYMAEMPLALPE